MLTVTFCPTLTAAISRSKTSASTQTTPTSAIWKSISPGMKRMPATAFFSSTTPPTGAR